MSPVVRAGLRRPSGAVITLFLLLPMSCAKPELICAIDMGSNNFLFPPGELEGRILGIEALRDRLREVTTMGPDAFDALKNKKDIDRALPRLIVAVSMMEAFGYTQLELTERELGAGLIIEAGLMAADSP